MRRLIAVIGMIACGMVAALAGGGAAHAATIPAPADCTGIAQIVGLGFTPAVVTPGQSVSAQLVVQNCTASTQHLSVQWYARFVDGSGQIPPGCVVVDPVILPLDLPPSGQGISTFGLQVFSGCTATALEVTATLRAADGSTIAQQTADVPIRQHNAGGGIACTASFVVQSQWTGGFVAILTVTNTGTVTLTNWVITITFGGDEKIVSVWNATVTQSGTQVIVKNLGYNGTLPPGGSVSIGMQGTGTPVPPISVTLNGVPCTLA